MKKNLILVLITIFTSAFLYILARYIKIDTVSFAIALNFMLMGCTLAFTETLKSPLNLSYFNVKSWERKGKIYESIGINLFRKILVWIGWEKLNKKMKPVEKSTEALAFLHYKTKQDELGHLIIMFIVLGFTIYAAFTFGFIKSLPLLLSNIFLNLYPIFLQRYNRPRIERVLNLSKRKQLKTA
jgi:hypothetical protein